jgi:hypothetical protein
MASSGMMPILDHAVGEPVAYVQVVRTKGRRDRLSSVFQLPDHQVMGLACGGAPQANPLPVNSMRLFQISLVLRTVLGTSAAEATEEFNCTATQWAGFIHNKRSNEWEGTANAARDKYVLRRFGLGWAWNDAPGNVGPWTYCDAKALDGFLYCHRIEDVRVDIKRLRFQVIWPLGYAWGPDAANGIDGTESPSIEIGRCIPQS